MRLFVALPIPFSVADELAARARAALVPHPRARIYTPADLHLTLRFFGDLSPARAEDLRVALDPIRAPALQLDLTGVGAFRDVGVLFAAVAPSPELQALAEVIDEALAWRGFTRERRPFHPHITLARLRHTLPHLELARWSQNWSPLHLRLHQLAIFRSPDRSAPASPARGETAGEPADAPRYTVLHHLPFGPHSPHVTESL